MNKQNVSKAIEKLTELDQFVSVDSRTGGPESELSPRFHCYIVFFELLARDEKKGAILDSLVSVSELLQFAGAIVLSADSDPFDCSGHVELLELNEPREKAQVPLFKNPKTLGFKEMPEQSMLAIPPRGSVHLQAMPFQKTRLLAQLGIRPTVQSQENRWYYETAYSVRSKSLELAQDRHLLASLTWSKSVFARFFFDLKARLEGNYVRGRSPSLYGLFFDGVL